MIGQDCSSAAYFWQCFVQWQSPGKAALLTGSSKQINHGQMEGKGEETTRVNENAILRSCVIRQAMHTFERDRRKCGHTASTWEGAKNIAAVSEP